MRKKYSTCNFSLLRLKVPMISAVIKINIIYPSWYPELQRNFIKTTRVKYLPGNVPVWTVSLFTMIYEVRFLLPCSLWLYCWVSPTCPVFSFPFVADLSASSRHINISLTLLKQIPKNRKKKKGGIPGNNNRIETKGIKEDCVVLR